MTQLRAHVYRDRRTHAWQIEIDDPRADYAPGATWSSWAGSHPEAMQAAYKMLSDLDAALMGEVNASRVSRRAQREAQLAELHPMELRA